MKIYIALIFMFFTVTSSFAEDSFDMVYYDDWQPFSWRENGLMMGLLIDIADEALHNRLGLTVNHKGYPWERAQTMVKKGIADAFISAPLPFRTAYTEFSAERVTSLTMSGFIKTGNPKMLQLTAITSASDLKHFKVGAYLGAGWHKANLKGMNVDFAASQETCLKMLLHGRFDVFIDAAEVVRFKLKQMKLTGQITELPNPLDTIDFHLCVGKKSSYVDILPKFDAAIKAMKQDGTLESIYKKYQ